MILQLNTYRCVCYKKQLNTDCIHISLQMAYTCTYMHHAYTDSQHAALFGLWSLSPLSSISVMQAGCVPGQGVLPALNTSQQVTPNDHWVDLIVCNKENNHTSLSCSHPVHLTPNIISEEVTGQALCTMGLQMITCTFPSQLNTLKLHEFPWPWGSGWDQPLLIMDHGTQIYCQASLATF